MNAIVRRYTRGKPVSEKLRINAVWERLAKKYANENDVRGTLPTFGQTALAFIREMESGGRESTSGHRLNREKPNASANQSSGNANR